MTFDQMTSDDRWLGFGYLGSRGHMLNSTDPEAPAEPVLVAATDQRVLTYAAEHKWSEEDLFQWANSKNGRHFADVMFGGDERFDERFAKAVAWGLMAVPA